MFLWVFTVIDHNEDVKLWWSISKQMDRNMEAICYLLLRRVGGQPLQKNKEPKNCVYGGGLLVDLSNDVNFKQENKYEY